MDAKTCIQKLKLIASVSMATVDQDGNPQVRTIGVMHAAEERLYFLTARGKPFYQELLHTKKVAILGLSRFKEMIRLNGTPELLPKERQKEWVDFIFEKNPYMNHVYPGDSRYILETFCVQSGRIEYFHLGVHPIFREEYAIGTGLVSEKRYQINNTCTSCGKCAAHCPQGCIAQGAPYRIVQEHCLRCGLCAELCPSHAVAFR